MKTKQLIISLITMGVTLVSQAGIILTVSEVGSDVILTGSGSANTADLTNINGTSGGGYIYSDYAIIRTATPASGFDYYSGISGPTTLGSVSGVAPSSSTGDMIGVYGRNGYIYLPDNYVSGTALSGSSTFANKTIASLGLTEGTYEWTWGSGPTADSLTLNVIPEPSVLALVGVFGGGIFAIRRFFLI